MDIDKPETPVDAYQLFMSVDVIDRIVYWTNKRAEKFFNDNPDKEGKINSLKWTPITSEDMYTYLALVKLMGIIK